MKSNLFVNFSVDKENKVINVERAFAAPISKVWSAWTEREILDKWWAPKPWKAKTKSLDFSVGGYWLYSMVGPEGEEHWARADYDAIDELKSFSATDAFCDQDGKINDSFPKSKWTNSFQEKDDLTTVSVIIHYDKLSDLEAIIEMGFKEGFLSALSNLDELL